MWIKKIDADEIMGEHETMSTDELIPLFLQKSGFDQYNPLNIQRLKDWGYTDLDGFMREELRDDETTSKKIL